ncbi:MAG TPA: hypothetical protein VE981_16290 [Planctomycetota bacterium]|nr:hypothetical protein [Planctomycetota bacterium]
MNPFDSLVRRTEREWRRTRSRIGAFPDIATRLLTEFEYGLRKEQLDEWLVRWFRKGEIPEQVSLHNTFGQPPITLFNNGEVVVDLYLWLTCDTAIHSHGFRGAFRVLHGKSLHEAFRVKVARRIAPGVMDCDPGIPELALLGPGDVRTILPGEKLTHRVIHLENPTVTLCVKTINEPGLYQWEYHPDGLAVQRRHLDPGLIKGLYYFQSLLGQNPDLATAFLEKRIRALSVVSRMNLYEEISGGAYDFSDETIDECLAQIRAQHGDEPWFRRYESAIPFHLKDLAVECCESPPERLVAHLINRAYDRTTSARLLSGLTGREFSEGEVRELSASLMDYEPIFGCELSMEDRARIRDLILHPARRIPAALQPFGQIPRMRAFIAGFPRLQTAATRV